MPGLDGWQLAALAVSRHTSGKQCACVANRKVRLPLRLGVVGICVQLEWRAECHAHVGRADVKHVAGVAVTGVAGGIDKAELPRCRRQVHPSPCAASKRGLGYIVGEDSPKRCARAREGRTGVGIGPGVAAVRGADRSCWPGW